MIEFLLNKLIGGKSKRYKMTIMYIFIYLLLALLGKLDAMAFATFSGVFSVWIVGDSLRK